MKALLRKCLWRTLLLLAYCMFGSWLFHHVEKTPITYSQMSAKMLDDLYHKYNVTMNQTEFMEFANDAYEAFKIGKKVDWTFLNASSYVFTILTTIGKNGPRTIASLHSGIAGKNNLMRAFLYPGGAVMGILRAYRLKFAD